MAESEVVGCLGEMSNAQAMASLLSCPLLEDLSEWSQWELIFKPTHGLLKDFIERHAGTSQFIFMFKSMVLWCINLILSDDNMHR